MYFSKLKMFYCLARLRNLSGSSESNGDMVTAFIKLIYVFILGNYIYVFKLILLKTYSIKTVN